MRKEESRVGRAPVRGGYMGLLSLVICMLIAVIFYVIYTNKGVEMGTGEQVDDPPWRIWTRNQIKLRDEPIGKPTEAQPQLDAIRTIDATAYDIAAADQPAAFQTRGSIDLTIDQGGSIIGGWGGSYWVNKDLQHEVVTAGTKGNIIPERVYEDEEGQDPGKLYFITFGMFSILETNNDSGRVRNVMGDIYVAGWIDKEYGVKGRVTITSDERNFKAYDFEGVATKMM